MALQLIANVLIGGIVGGLAHNVFVNRKKDVSNEGNSEVGSDRGRSGRSKSLRDQATRQELGENGNEGQPPIEGDEGDGESHNLTENGADNEGGQDGPSGAGEESNQESEKDE